MRKTTVIAILAVFVVLGVTTIALAQVNPPDNPDCFWPTPQNTPENHLTPQSYIVPPAGWFSECGDVCYFTPTVDPTYIIPTIEITVTPMITITPGITVTPGMSGTTTPEPECLVICNGSCEDATDPMDSVQVYATGPWAHTSANCQVCGSGTGYFVAESRAGAYNGFGAITGFCSYGVPEEGGDESCTWSGQASSVSASSVAGFTSGPYSYNSISMSCYDEPTPEPTPIFPTPDPGSVWTNVLCLQLSSQPNSTITIKRDGVTIPYQSESGLPYGCATGRIRLGAKAYTLFEITANAYAIDSNWQGGYLRFSPPNNNGAGTASWWASIDATGGVAANGNQTIKDVTHNVIYAQSRYNVSYPSGGYTNDWQLNTAYDLVSSFDYWSQSGTKSVDYHIFVYFTTDSIVFTPTPGATPTVTATATITATPTLTATPTITPTPTMTPDIDCFSAWPTPYIEPSPWDDIGQTDGGCNVIIPGGDVGGYFTIPGLEVCTTYIDIPDLNDLLPFLPPISSLALLAIIPGMWLASLIWKQWGG